ncbi:hypothetical protein BEL04_08655 [Mucilaginibacter sp. PPCGB 2223]|uniref:hypothetical protein n=1 Tax=Mucilaginibacter sp. PPCGB 2223 TaxID=1886027 RepID=UPI000826641A|nr:hypothetical protein [Mucilaginibacter sp. PPCGB 2223]OCX54319.1 hypothetical protein BEL04_08655 [Mucilaginibacter sp. PPCGB 2223]
MSNLSVFLSSNRNLPYSFFGKSLIDFNNDELEDLLHICLEEKSIISPLLSKEDGPIEFLSEVLRTTSIDVFDNYSDTIDKIFLEAIQEKERFQTWSELQVRIIINALRLSNRMKRGIQKDSLIGVINSAHWDAVSKIPEAVLKDTATLISIYPSQNSDFWMKIDIQRFPFLIGPCINGLAGYPDACMEFLKKLTPKEIKPDLQFPLSKFIRNMFNSRLDDNAKRKAYRNFYKLNYRLQEEINSIIALVFETDDPIFKLVEPIKFWKYYVRSKSFAATPKRKSFFPASEFYDTSIFPYGIQNLDIATKYNLQAQVFKLPDYVDDAPLLLNRDLKSALEKIKLNKKYDFIARDFKEGNILITYPIEAFKPNQQGEGMDIAVLNLFNYAIISNVVPDATIYNELYEKNIHTPKLVRFCATLLQIIKASSNKREVNVYVNDSGIKGVMDDSFGKLLGYFKDHFDRNIIFSFHFIVVKGQKKLIDRLNTPNSIVITTGPVLAQIFEWQLSGKNSFEYFSNSKFVEELLNIEEKTEAIKLLISSLETSLLHQSLHINIPIEKYRDNPEHQSVVHKYAKLTYFTSEYIAKNIQRYVDFVEKNQKLFKLSGQKPSRRSIEQAILFSYIFGHHTKLNTSDVNLNQTHNEIYKKVIVSWSQALNRLGMNLVMHREKATDPATIDTVDFLQAVLNEIITFGEEDYLLSSIEPQDLEPWFNNHLYKRPSNTLSTQVANA